MASQYQAYTGIGSRQTPDDVLALMSRIALSLSECGWTLRSGGAPGADQAFGAGAGVQAEIYLPWPSFESITDARLSEPQPEAFPIAARFHPAWDRLSQGARRLHARNVHQILGPDVTSPVLSRFVIGWTVGGAGRGGTGQAYRIAQHYDVPIFDLARPADRARIRSGLSLPL